jgi:CBS domain-containing protein
MLADSRPVTGVAISSHLTDTLMGRTGHTVFLRALLREAIRWRTSAGRWRDFLVDRVGVHRGQLDLKRGGLFPVVALGRWVGVAAGDGRGGTPERLRRGEQAGIITADERDTLIGGFDGIYTVLYDHEIAAGRTGEPTDTFIRPRDLSTLVRRHLHETLRAVSAVQDRLDQFWLRRIDAQLS